MPFHHPFLSTNCELALAGTYGTPCATNRFVTETDERVVSHTGLRSWVSVPDTAGSAGVAGQEAYSTTHHYICVAANTWKRTELSTWS